MKMKQVISIEWWINDENRSEPLAHHVEALQEAAQSRINALMSDGYTSGQLIESIRSSEDDPEEGVHYLGWWESSVEVVQAKPSHKWFVINGRLPGDAEDTCKVIPAESKEAALKRFVEELWVEGNGNHEYITSVVCSEFPAYIVQ